MTVTSAELPTLKYYTGEEYQGDQVLNLAEQLAGITDFKSLSGGVFGESKPSVGFDYTEAQKLLGRDPTTVDQVLLDAAANLIKQGITDISQLKPNTRQPDETLGETMVDPNIYVGQTYSGPGVTSYRISFDSNTGAPVFGTIGSDTSDRGNIIAVATMLAAPYLSNLFGPASAGLTDAGFLAADAAQLAAQGLSEYQIAATLSASGYGSTAAANLAASMAANGLNVADMTTQLTNLSSNTGLMQQNLSPGEFLSYDAMNLQGTLGNNFAAIEQNLIASGVDPLVAADVSQQLAFNPNLTQSELASNLTNNFGSNIYDVNTAQTYPTSVLGGSGGTLNDVFTGPVTAEELGQGFQDYTSNAGYTPVADNNVPEATYSNEGRNYPNTESTQGAGGSPVNASTAGAGESLINASTAGTPGLSASTISNLIRAGLALTGAGSAVSNMGGSGGGGGGIGALPSQSVPIGNQDYYNAIQQYYNAYMPEVPRNVATPLQQWYNSKYGA